MEFKQLQDMALFALVAECGSFTAAAQRVGLPKSSVSQRISQLEQTLGLRLLNRTTRQLNLTFAGERYLEHCQVMMSAAERADLALQRLRDNPSGRLRISTPAGLGATLVARLAADFQRQYPDVSLEVSVSDAMVDLVQEGFDAALRTGKPQDSSLIGRRLGYAPRYLLAAPSYLAQHPPIEHPQQLQQHRCIAHRAWTAWNLRCGDDYYRWQLPLAHTTDNLLYARECAIAGAGITLLPAFLSREVVAQKLLVEVLPAWRAEGNELYLVYPSRKLNSAALACFIDVVLQHPAFDDYARELARE
ncbi:LysR family transcriptional regulator [Serratia marcescens]|jgi:DNA-binding transcriptional LysR family regulator|uniref:LysR family transcriptional regulator n=1 Tax=Serratia marcescens TaxID=615 RepID=A0ABD6HR46_SERMA|nr:MULTISPECIES: LysR family transcriptional regulator [Serratia]AGE16469.1 LysR family transcriptional regulator [Serratia marcescens WW4]AIA45655.1 LysR family transcriptional regulator [Serratia sp. FS14]ANM79310.1 lysR substrate binding domain protein [Serratia marcescens]ASC76992.1 LysR family transcriptional regulator [Serratia marcescens]AXX21033.1 LysR family transcriptional regulator [Serratia marcescens]